MGACYDFSTACRSTCGCFKCLKKGGVEGSSVTDEAVTAGWARLVTSQENVFGGVSYIMSSRLLQKFRGQSVRAGVETAR